MPGGDALSLPSLAEVEAADWPSLQAMCASLGLNPKGRSAIVRMRIADHVRHRTRAPAWRPSREHQAALLTRLGLPDVAERLWESTIQLDAPAPWVGLGHAQLAGGFLAEAGKSFGRAAQMGDASGDLHRSEALAAGGDFEGAARACDAYLSSHPGDLRGLAMKAAFLDRAGFVDEALKLLGSAVELHPDVPGVARTLGVALLKAGRPLPAAVAFRDAARIDPLDLDSLANRGAALLLAGRTREAIGVLREALEIDPRQAEALNNLGVAYLALGHTRSAAVNLERAAKHLESPRILLNLAQVREDADDPAAALRAYDQVLRLRPNDSEAVAGRRRVASPARSKRANPKKAPSAKKAPPARSRRPRRGRRRSRKPRR